jgi:hypothetical protein
MMKRDFSKFAQVDPEVQGLLDELARPYEEVREDKYRELMRKIGLHLATGLLSEGVDQLHDKNICIVCTVEDADFLASGVLDGLERGGVDAERLHLQCFWNDKIREGAISLSPVSRQYSEPFDTAKAAYVIVKSIISGACVVKTNLTRVLSNAGDADVYVAAPVLLDGAQKKLASEFPTSIASRFKYVWFATDHEKNGEDVLPGIGGSVYQRLGLGDEVSKNKHVPDIVKLRRSQKFGAPKPERLNSGFQNLH